mgnify:CR=1 FL=1
MPRGSRFPTLVLAWLTLEPLPRRWRLPCFAALGLAARLGDQPLGLLGRHLDQPGHRGRRLGGAGDDDVLGAAAAHHRDGHGGRVEPLAEARQLGVLVAELLAQGAQLVL